VTAGKGERPATGATSGQGGTTAVVGPRLRIPGGQRVTPNADGRYLVELGRFWEPVTGVASILVTRTGASPLRVTTKSFQVSAGDEADLVFGLSAAARELMSRGGLSVRLVVSARNKAGVASTGSVAATLAPPGGKS
jgi:hypothetical protein